MQQKILITGGYGLVGSAFKNGYKVGSEIDLRDYNKVEELFNDLRPDVVIHTAAKVGGVMANMNYPADFLIDNIRMNTNVIDVCKKTGVKKLICFLSTCIFPDIIDYPLDESKIELGPPHYSNFAYAYAKRMSEVQIQAYNKQFNTKYYSVIPTNVYGPHDNFNLENGHVIPMLIHKCYIAKKNNTSFQVWGSGKPLREFIFSEDLVNIIQLLVEKYDGVDPILISNPKEYTIKNLVDLIVEIMEFSGPVEWLTDKPDGQLRKPSNNKKLLSIIGDYNFVSLEEGLKKTIDWFYQNYNNIRK